MLLIVFSKISVLSAVAFSFKNFKALSIFTNLYFLRRLLCLLKYILRYSLCLLDLQIVFLYFLNQLEQRLTLINIQQIPIFELDREEKHKAQKLKLKQKLLSRGC